MSGMLPYQTPYSVEQIENMKVIYGYYKDDQSSREEATEHQKKFYSWGGKINLVYSPTGRPATDDDLVRFPDKVQAEIVYDNKYKEPATTKPPAKASKKGSGNRNLSSKSKTVVSINKTAKKVGRPKKKENNRSTTATRDEVTAPALAAPSAAADSPNQQAMMVENGPATEPELVALGGWTKKTFLRQSGASKGSIDKYWYSPKLQKKFRSMAQVKKFLRCVDIANGDEEHAFELFKGRLDKYSRDGHSF